MSQYVGFYNDPICGILQWSILWDSIITHYVGFSNDPISSTNNGIHVVGIPYTTLSFLKTLYKGEDLYMYFYLCCQKYSEITNNILNLKVVSIFICILYLCRNWK